MKYPLFTFLLLVGLSRATAQSKTRRDSPTYSFSAYKPVVIRLQAPEERKSDSLGPFRHFEILDERPDTSRFGAHAGQTALSNSRQMVFAKQASQEFGDYLDARFSNPTAPCTLLIVLRKLWISDAIYTPADVADNSDLSNDRINIRLKAEVYAEKAGVYTPLFRYDSTRISQSAAYTKTGRSRAGSDLAGMFDDLAERALITIARLGDGGRKLSLDDIFKFNRSRFDPPIFNPGSVLARGVYKDFRELQDNAPSIQDFEIAKEKEHLMLYRKEAGGKIYYCRDAWGYCDGKTIYVMKDGVLIPAWKEGKCYYMLAMALQIIPDYENVEPAIPIGGSGGFIPLSKPGIHRQKEVIHIYTVDMDTGDIL